MRGDFWTQAEWCDWSDDLARLVPEEYHDDIAQEAIIENALADLVRRVTGYRVEWGIRFPSGAVQVATDEAEARRYAFASAALRPDLPALVVRKVVSDWEDAS